MAVKNNLYDALEYAGQVEETAKSHQREMDYYEYDEHPVIRKRKVSLSE